MILSPLQCTLVVYKKMLFNITPWAITGNFAGMGEPSRTETLGRKKRKKKATKKKTTKKKKTKAKKRK